MAIEVTIPRLGWSMDEGTFGEWLKSDGDFVAAGDAIFMLESEKALQEIESVDSGTLSVCPDGPQEGDVLKVGTRIGWLLQDGEQPPTATAEKSDIPAAEPIQEIVAESDLPPDNATSRNQPAFVDSPTPTQPVSRKAAPVSPRAARLAAELSLDTTGLTGSGRGGRIREMDVRAAMTQEQPVVGTQQSVDASSISGTRRAIASKMLQSSQQTAPVTLTTRADVSQLVNLRQQFKSREGHVVPSYQSIIAKLTALMLQQHPTMNSQWQDDGIVQPDGVHIGFAVDTEAGLLVPVVKHCDRNSLTEISRQSVDLIDRARRRRCTAQELGGGTFTLTNLGAYGIDGFTPILNTPESGILGLGAIRREAVVQDDDKIVVRDCMALSLTFDHRVIDGAPAARFLQDLCHSIESPAPHLID